jgi:formate hydrogenlyase subunit 6/NADH:ubiquinone oxidoreductase subunit I
MNFNIGHCQLKCTLCSEVCPDRCHPPDHVEEKIGEGRTGTRDPCVSVPRSSTRNRCLPHAMEIPCVVCEEVCPTSPKAIQTNDEEAKDVFGEIVMLNKPFMVPDLCIGCGICEGVPGDGFSAPCTSRRLAKVARMSDDCCCRNETRPEPGG